MISSQFAFALCQPGAERALKAEFARVRPAWAPAYQRPGLVTFRSPDLLVPELALESVFARQHGISFGSFAELDALAARIRELALAAPCCLQVTERAPARPDQPALGANAQAIERALRARCGACLGGSARAALGQLVLSVVVAEADAPLLGAHRHAPGRCPYPGGRYPIELPEQAPSRAYLKLEEAIAAFALPIRAGDTALELGAAPGGAAYALVRRGVQVIAVDPAALDPQLLALRGPHGARALQLPLTMGELDRAQLPPRVDWLLLDVHLAPQIALRGARKLASQLKRTLLGAVLTLKLNEWRFAEQVDSFLQQAREMGLRSARAKQLASHRRELAVAGLTARGAARV